MHTGPAMAAADHATISLQNYGVGTQQDCPHTSLPLLGDTTAVRMRLLVPSCLVFTWRMSPY